MRVATVGARARTLASVVVVAALAACSSSSGGGGGGATTPAGTTPPPTTAAVVSTPNSAPASASATATPADAATTAAVTHAYETMLNYKTPKAAAAALLQDGKAFAPALAAMATVSAKQKITVKVSSVSMVSAKTAKVIFTLFGAGTPLLPNTSGYAVLENGKWKVSGQTFCALLQLNSTPSPACSQPAATTLP